MTLAIAQSAQEFALRQLCQELRTRWSVGDRLPPIKQLAATLNVGQTSLHRAAAELAQRGILVASTRRGTYLARLPEDDADSPAIRCRAALLQLPLHLTDPFLEPAVEQLEAHLRRHGVEMQRVAVDIRSRPEPGQRLDGFGAMIALQPSTLVKLANDVRCPALVLTTSEVEPMAIEAGYDMVSADSEQGAMLAGQWMRRVDPRGVAFVGVAATRAMDSFEEISRKRLVGFERGLGRSVPRRHQFISGAFRPGIGQEVFEQYLAMRRRPQGLFCASDDLAAGFLQSAAEHGLVAGEDFHLIGFDGQVRGQVAPGGPLTTVRVPTQAMGRAAAELLLSRLDQPEQPVRRVLLSCDFIEGRTARPR